MNSISFLSPILLPPPHRLQLQPNHHHHHLSSSFPPLRSLCPPQSSMDASATPSNEGTVSVMNFEDLVQKDWSFLDSDPTNSDEQRYRIISAGDIGENSRVLVSIPSEEFVDQLVDSAPSQLLLVVHDSLLVLACIKEKYDKVKCWHGDLISVPDKWTPFDVVFLYYLPALPFQLAQIFRVLAERCLSGARLVISYPQGREVVEQQRQQYPDVVISDLPGRMTLEKVAADHSFEITEFVDEPALYLAVLKFCKVGTSAE
ncbi:hypothetical protein HHK36_017645 [Tetracentron sinense]|uniref:Uncharacterized protein n=1 Tax=Tetracentron sinense TaxID=13715 RepID=A0A835D9L5_TETSI|nr:hypothetical protein HHK36_017645 [Tetracentron sinense]